MTRPHVAISAALLVLLLRCTAAKSTIGNHGISSSFCNISDIIVNPPQYDFYLTPVTDVPSVLTVTIDGIAHAFDAIFGGALGDTTFPSCRLQTWRDGVSFTFNAFAPISPASSIQGFLPFIVLQLGIENNDTRPHAVSLAFSMQCGGGFCNSSSRSGLIVNPDGSQLLSFNDSIWVGAKGLGADSVHTCVNNVTLCANASAVVAPREAGRVTLVVGHYASTGRYAAAYPLVENLWHMALIEEDALAAAHASFVAAIPTVGIPDVDIAQRWFLTAPILLTKGVGNTSLTMG